MKLAARSGIALHLDEANDESHHRQSPTETSAIVPELLSWLRLPGVACELGSSSGALLQAHMNYAIGEYKVLSAPTSEKLNQIVNQHLKTGWLLSGPLACSICTDSNLYAQVVVRAIETPDAEAK